MALENFVNELAIAATIVGTLASAAYFPQAYKIWKRKSVEDLSLPTFALFFLSIVVWLFYGISMNNYPIMIGNSVATVGSAIVLFLYFKYKKRGKK